MLDKLPDILEVDVYEFEELIREFAKSMGFEIISSSRTPEGVIDILAKTTNPMGGKVKSIVRAAPFGKDVDMGYIKRMQEDMVERGAVRAAFITTSGFTPEAKDFVKGKPISLIDKYKLLESLDKQGIKINSKLHNLLKKYGLAEHMYEASRHSFLSRKTKQEVMEYFNKRRKRKLLGVLGSEETVKNISIRNAPVGIFRVTESMESRTSSRSLAKTEQEDYLFINLNNADLYYIRIKRGARSRHVFESSQILRTIFNLPEESKEHLIDLLVHGDLPYRHLEDKHLAILEATKVVEVGEPEDSSLVAGPLKSVANFLSYVGQEVSDFIPLFFHSLFGTGDVGTPERDLGKEKTEEDEERKVVRANIPMPHYQSGIYDLRGYLDIEKGLETKFEDDDVKYSSVDITSLLKSIFNSAVEPKGIVFIPYFICSYAGKDIRSISRRETLIAPKFLGDTRAVKKRVGKKKESGTPYKLIR